VLPIYGEVLGATALEVGGFFSAFSLVPVIVRPFLGRALDRWGRRWRAAGCTTTWDTRRPFTSTPLFCSWARCSWRQCCEMRRCVAPGPAQRRLFTAAWKKVGAM